MSDGDRNVDRNIYPDSVTRDGIRSDVLCSENAAAISSEKCLKRSI